ncbi:MAG TPA: MxaK protein [Ideonella sp.]|nr:MxaK protein [Ideonella sp.]
MGLSLATLGGRRATRGALLLLAVLALAATVDAALLWRKAHWNQLIAAEEPVPEAGGQPPELRFAQAAAQAASGALEPALDRYRPLQGDSPLGQAARFNSANLLVRQALEVKASNQPGQAIALLELAKEGYREVLRHDPQHWDARYNLERAQRLLPDPEEIDAPQAETPRDRERAATTMRAYSPGLP